MWWRQERDAGGEDSGDVDQRVQLAVQIDDRCDDLFPVGLVCDVERQEAGALAELCDYGDVLAGAVGDDDGRTSVQEMPDDLKADAAKAAGDQNGAVGK
jgi:hypothetical protein